MRPLHWLPCLCLFLLLAACSGDGRASAPELVARDAVAARAFDPDQCHLMLAAAAPAFLNPDPEPGPAGEAPAGEAPALQVVLMKDGPLWYQLDGGMWVRVDEIEHETRGDCAP